MNMFEVELAQDGAQTPKRMTDEAAGYDLYSSESMIIPPRCRILVSTGLKMALPYGTYGRVAPRSGLSVKGIDVGAGVVDSDYRGIVKVLLINSNEEGFEIKHGDRIAQLIIEPIMMPPVNIVDKLTDTKRGVDGFGSTGV